MITPKCSLLFLLLFCFSMRVFAQQQNNTLDTTNENKKSLIDISGKNQHLTIGGYMQPQFQVAQSKGAKNYVGGDFQPNSNNRFMLRRGRFKLDYTYKGKNKIPGAQFVFQIDATERGVVIQDVYGKVMENNLQFFSLSMGMFTRPFGYEMNLSSSDRESPERGRMSQILMKSQRDLGAMLSFEPENKSNFLQYIRLDAGVFNGQGLTATTDYDSYKDFVSRLSLKPYPIQKNLFFSAGLSYLNGGFIQNNKYVYTLQNNNTGKQFVVDSSAGNIGKELPRKYYGADMQLKWLHTSNSFTAFRAEYWQGTQTATALTSETPATLQTIPYFIRKFNGAFFYLIHRFDAHHELGFKYDWYDPNTGLSAKEINTQTGASPADITYSTFGLGYIYHVNEKLKILAWYDIVKNEITSFPGYEADLKDNIFTLRMQIKF